MATCDPCIHACMGVCVYVCMHVCMYVHMFVCACMYVDMYVCACMYVCRHVCLHACIYLCCIYLCISVSSSLSIYACIYLCMYVFMYVCIMYVYIRSHASINLPISTYWPAVSKKYVLNIFSPANNSFYIHIYISACFNAAWLVYKLFEVKLLLSGIVFFCLVDGCVYQC